MVAQERQAAFNLAVAGASLGLFGALFPLVGMSKAQAAFAVLAFLAIGPIFHYRRLRGDIAADERDRAIMLRATHISFMVLWAVFVAGIMAAYLILHDHSAVPIDVLPLIVWLGCECMLICHSAVLLALYRWS